MTEKMKPSGIGWIKDIPESWKTSKVKFLATEPGTLFLDGDWIESDVIEESGIRYLTSGNVGAGFYKDQGSGHISEKTFNELHCLKVFPGDLMISRLNEPIGRACIVPEGEPCYVVAVDNVILRPNKEYDRKFIMYAMNTEGYAEHGNMIARGATMSRVSRSQLGQFWLAFPGITEQRAIVDFLDAQCAKIDSVIADIEKQIETLQQYKKSLITEAVTKGLNRSVPMKNSGIDWIGDIPMHWDIHRIKDTCSLARGGSPRPINEYLSDNPNDLNWIRIGDTVKGSKYIIQTEQKIIKSGLSNSRLVHEGDLLLTNSMSFGQPYILKITGCIHDGWLVFSDYRGIDKLFLYYALMSELCYIQFKTSVAGAVVENLSIDKVGISKIFVPPIEEQERIVKYLDEKCVIIDEILLKKEEQLETMKQHKKSLIYEYVTGKKRVTEVN